jgi:hypothetical protein
MTIAPHLRWNCGDPQFQNVVLFDIVTDWKAGGQDGIATLAPLPRQ